MLPKSVLETTTKMSKIISSTADESHSSPPTPFLPDELIFTILLWLPIQSLMRFKCVCRLWKTMISSLQFAKDHNRTSIVNPNMTYHRFVSSIIDGKCKIISNSIQSLLNPPLHAKPLTFTMRQKFQILGSCDGLLCLFDTVHEYIRLWNPTNRSKSKSFPIGNNVSAFSTVTYHGFGYDHMNDKYKVLLVEEDFDDSVTKIFTFGENSWTIIQNFPHHPSLWLGKFVSGTLNWLAKGSDYQWVIVSLDLGNETFGEVLLPKGKAEEICNLVLDVSRNSLCFCFFDLKRNHWVVWLMKEYGVQESWTKFMIIPRIEFKFAIYKWSFSIESFCILENGVILLKTSSCQFVVYNSNDGSWSYRGSWNKTGLDLHMCHESLISAMY